MSEQATMPIEIRFKEAITIPEGGYLRLEFKPVSIDEVMVSAVVTEPDGIEIQRCSWSAKISSKWSVVATDEEQGETE